MPILWRYLLSQYFRMIILCSTVFIALLLIMRLEDIAHFISLKAESLTVLLFVFYQVPYILPIALPISSLIAATLLAKNMSCTHELTAWRSSGFSLTNIFFPLLSVASLLAILNFIIVSEMATYSHLSTGLMRTELRSINPLLLLSNKHLMEVKGIHFDTWGETLLGESARDVILAMPNKHNGRLNLMIAKKLCISEDNFTGHQVTLISSSHAKETNQPDYLLVENIKKTTIPIPDFAQMIQKKVWTLNDDHLNLPMLLVRLHELKNGDLAEIAIKKAINKIYSEIFRRISLGVAVLSLTLMGLAFGITISRNKMARGIWSIVTLTSLFLISLFAAKGLDQHIMISFIVFFLPHAIIFSLSLVNLKRIASGVES